MKVKFKLYFNATLNCKNIVFERATFSLGFHVRNPPPLTSPSPQNDEMMVVGMMLTSRAIVIPS